MRWGVKKTITLLSLFSLLITLSWPLETFSQTIVCNQTIESYDIINNPFEPVIDNQREIRIGRITDTALSQLDDTIEKAGYLLQKTERIIQALESVQSRKGKGLSQFCPISNCISSCVQQTISPSCAPGPNTTDQYGRPSCECTPQGVFCNGIQTSTGNCYQNWCGSCESKDEEAQLCYIFPQTTICRLDEQNQCQLVPQKSRVCEIETLYQDLNNINILGRTGASSLQTLVWEMKRHYLPRYLPYVYYSQIYKVGDMAGLVGKLGRYTPPLLYEVAQKIDLSKAQEMLDPAFGICLYPSLFYEEEYKEIRGESFSQCLSEREFEILRESIKARNRIFGGGGEGIERTGCWQNPAPNITNYIIPCYEVLKTTIPQASFFGTSLGERDGIEIIAPLAKGCYGSRNICPSGEDCANDYYCCTIILE